MTALSAQDLDDGVEVVPAGGVDRHTGRFVDDEHVVVLMDDTDRLRGHRGLVAVEGVRDDLAVLDPGGWGRDFAADGDLAGLDGMFLEKRLSVNDRRSRKAERLKETNIILRRPVPELGREDLKQLPPPPSLLAVGVIGVVVGLDAA